MRVHRELDSRNDRRPQWRAAAFTKTSGTLSSDAWFIHASRFQEITLSVQCTCDWCASQALSFTNSRQASLLTQDSSSNTTHACQHRHHVSWFSASRPADAKLSGTTFVQAVLAGVESASSASDCWGLSATSWATLPARNEAELSRLATWQ